MAHTVAAFAALLVAFLAGGGIAHATIPAGLKTSCTLKTPHAGFTYQFCDDGLPPTGGTTVNTGGVAAVTVPAKYDPSVGGGWQGLPPKAGDAASVPGADSNGDIALDVDIAYPTSAAPAGGYPLVVFMHGCCAGSKTGWEATTFDQAGERWHYSNAWFASRGYVAVTYTARGFVNGSNNGNKGSTGQTHIDSRLYEINDFQHLAGQIADDPFFNVNPQKVVATGGSYGGGFAWLALTDPFWNSPVGTPMKLAVTAPRYGWTDLAYSLMPTGRHFQTPDRLPATDGSDTLSPAGIPKKSISDLLYSSGTNGVPAGTAHATFTPEINSAFACLQSTDPFETNPLCTTPLATTLPSFINDRSAYYQNSFFASIASDPSYRVPIFNAATFTDPLFTAVENLRMSNRLQSVVPGYPIQQYFGDYEHFVQNKAKEWGDICTTGTRHVCTFADFPGGNLNGAPTALARTGVNTRLSRFVDHYVQPSYNPSEPQPAFDVTASLQICASNAASSGIAADEPGETFTAATFDQLAPNTLMLEMTGAQTTVNDASPNTHAGTADPIFINTFYGGCLGVDNSAAGAGVATYTSAPLSSTQTMVGGAAVSIDYTATTTSGNFQLNSRLYDVFPGGNAQLVDRGVRRVTSPSGTVQYQLQGNGWRFPAGHSIRIEIAQDDDPYMKLSNVSSSATLTKVKLEIPVREAQPVYPRPGGGTPLRVPLVPAFAVCSSPNATHTAPLALPSCTPPSLESSLLTTSTIGKQAAFAKLEAQPGNTGTAADEADIAITVSASDVRNTSGGTDYTGPTLLLTSIRATDRANAFFSNTAGTAQDAVLGVPLSCVSTPDPSAGGTCSASTTADTLAPGLAKEGKRAVISAFSFTLKDVGLDGNANVAGCPFACGTGDEGTYLRQGVALP